MSFLRKKSEKSAPEAVTEELPKVSLEEGLASLTNKNSDYVHDVRKQLSQFGKSDEEINAILEDILPEILDAQKNGTTARVLKGTPTEFVAKYKPKANEKKKKETNKNPYLMILDSFLLIFALLGAIFGVTMEFQTSEQVYGLTTLVLSSIVGAIGMYMVYNFQIKFSERKSGDKPSLWQRLKPSLQLIAFMFIWFAVMVFSGLLPRVINPVVDGITMIIMAIIAIGIRFLLKRKFNTQSAFSSRLTQQDTRK
ncbi:MAG: DUF1129 family protein [Streptococcaceae bacterium]|jgi:uncharacterized membrane-anchored protein|nr:DUF1129 family protein [Streptococcaceae bacterium]